MKNLLNSFQESLSTINQISLKLNASITFYLFGVVSIIFMIIVHRLAVKNRRKNYSFQTSFVFLLTLITMAIFVNEIEVELPFAFGSGLFALITSFFIVVRNQNIKYLTFYILMISNLIFTFLQM